jgi:hypothetical protein
MGLAPDAARAKIQAFGGSVGNALVNCLTLLLRTDSDLLSQLTTEYAHLRKIRDITNQRINFTVIVNIGVCSASPVRTPL